MACATAAISCAAFAFEPRRVALERGQPLDLHKILFPELADAFELLADQLVSRGFGRLLGVWPLISSCSWVMRCRSCAFCPARAVRRELKQFAFVGDCNRRHPARLGAGEQHRAGNVTAFGPVTFGFETRLARGEFVEAFGDDGKVGARDRIVEPYENIAGLDAVAVAHAELANNAAGRMLDLLHVGIDDDRAWRDERTGRSGSWPPNRRRLRRATARSGNAGQQMTMDGVARAPGAAAGNSSVAHFSKRSLDMDNRGIFMRLRSRCRARP